MMNKNNIPQHVAIIMDGNGRWAKERGLARTAGHRQGVERIREVISAASELGIKIITFFTFSTENWDRPKKEVSLLMRYLNNFLEREIRDLNKNNIRFKVIGRDEPLPKYLQEKIKRAEETTRSNSGLTVVMALNYGSKQEIVDAIKNFSQKVLKGEVIPEDLDERNFNEYLYTAGLPEPDLLIRTSGEMRISNFLLWQLAYSELYFPKKYWPDFHKEDLNKAIEVYQRRQRRFGRISA